MLCWFMLYNSVNQLKVYIHPLPLEFLLLKAESNIKVTLTLNSTSGNTFQGNNLKYSTGLFTNKFMKIFL